MTTTGRLNEKSGCYDSVNYYQAIDVYYFRRLDSLSIFFNGCTKDQDEAYRCQGGGKGFKV